MSTVLENRIGCSLSVRWLFPIPASDHFPAFRSGSHNLPGVDLGWSTLVFLTSAFFFLTRSHGLLSAHAAPTHDVGHASASGTGRVPF